MALFKSKKKSGDRAKREEFAIGDEHKIVFNSSGLIPVVIQDEGTSEVLRLGHLDKWALQMSLDEKKVYLFRRSLQRLELLGEKQGIEYEISTIKIGRDLRSMLFKVIPLPPRRTRRKDDSPPDNRLPRSSAIGNPNADPEAIVNDVQKDFFHTIYSKKKRA